MRTPIDDFAAILDALRERGVVELAPSSRTGESWLRNLLDLAAQTGLAVTVVDRGDLVALVDVEH